MIIVGNKFSWILRNTALNESATSEIAAEGIDDVTTHGIQNGFMLFFAFLVIGIFITSFFVRVSPIWLFLYIIFLVVTIITAAYLGNAYHKVEQIAVFSENASSFTMITWVMQHLVLISLAVGAISMIIVFSKFYGGYSSAT